MGIKVKTRIQFFSCHGDPLKPGGRASATCFLTLTKASIAAEEYSSDRGYLCEALFCETCKNFHVRQSTTPRFSEEEAWTPAMHRAVIRKAHEERAAAEKAAAQERRRSEEAASPRKPPREVKPTQSPQSRAARSAASTLNRRKERRAQGLCPFCGGPPVPGGTRCESCRVKYLKYNANRRARQAQAVSAAA